MKNLKSIFLESNDNFLDKEIDLIKNDLSERSICSKLGQYLKVEIDKKEEFKKYHIDAEYNRNYGEIKTILDENEEIIKITCDLIMHSRGELKNDNLIALEMKKSSRPNKEKISDKKRLIELTNPANRSNIKHVKTYSLGIYYEININIREILLEFYIGGEKIDKQILDISKLF